jgi:hypothetical protein
MLILETANRYRYNKLSNEDGSFRLLEILPATEITALIDCRLHPAHVERAAGTFAALCFCDSCVDTIISTSGWTPYVSIKETLSNVVLRSS